MDETKGVDAMARSATRHRAANAPGGDRGDVARAQRTSSCPHAHKMGDRAMSTGHGVLLMEGVHGMPTASRNVG